MESRWMKILSISSVEIQCRKCRYNFALDAVRKIESRSMSSCYRWTLALWQTVLFFNGLFWEEKESTLLPPSAFCFGYPQYASSAASSNALSTRNSILFSGSTKRIAHVLCCRASTSSRLPITLPSFNPTQLSALWKVSQRDRPFFQVLFVFPRAKPSFEAFSLAFLGSHYRHWLIVGEFCCTADNDDDSTVNRISDLSIYVMVIARRETIVDISSNRDISRNGFASIGKLLLSHC